MKLTRTKQFLTVMIPFAVLGAAFKVMVLVPGLTEVRPANAIPIIAGLAFGPVGALGCAVGNVIADLFGTFEWTSILGFIGNFVAAYLPYRLWHLIKKEPPNVHTYGNLALYVWLSFLSALTVAWILGFGLECFFGTWIQSLYRYVFFNNFGFSLVLGLPLFIVCTSSSVKLPMREAPKARRQGRISPGGWKRHRLVMILYTAAMTAVLGGVLLGMHLANSVTMKLLSVICLLLLIDLSAAACREGGDPNESQRK